VEQVDRYIDSIDWVTLCLVGCLIMFTLAKYLYPKRFQEFILLLFTNKYFLVHGKNDEIRHPFNLLLFIAQVISVSLFIFLFIKKDSPQIIQSNSWLFVQICSGYIIFILIKFSIEKIIGEIFSIGTVVNNYLYQKLSYRNLLGILFFVGNIFFFYVIEPSINLLIGLVISMVVINVLALFYSYRTNGKLILSNFFYFILYLCALEISPYIILYKALT